MKRRWVLLQPPKSGGRSRHGAPVRIIQKTALIKRRLSWALPPQLPSRPGKWGSSFFQTESEMSCRLWAAVGICSSLTLEGKRTMPQNENLDNLVTTLPKLERQGCKRRAQAGQDIGQQQLASAAGAADDPSPARPHGRRRSTLRGWAGCCGATRGLSLTGGRGGRGRCLRRGGLRCRG